MGEGGAGGGIPMLVSGGADETDVEPSASTYARPVLKKQISPNFSRRGSLTLTTRGIHAGCRYGGHEEVRDGTHCCRRLIHCVSVHALVIGDRDVPRTLS